MQDGLGLLLGADAGGSAEEAGAAWVNLCRRTAASGGHALLATAVVSGADAISGRHLTLRARVYAESIAAKLTRSALVARGATLCAILVVHAGAVAACLTRWARVITKVAA
jgi:hypothetical protein